MPLTDQVLVNSYTGNGVTTSFAYGFKIWVNTDLKVVVDGVLKTLTTHYTVSGVGADGGGNVTFVTAPANLAVVTITSEVAYSRGTDYQENGDLLAGTLDNDIDKSTRQIQQLRRDVKRAIKLPIEETDDKGVLTTPANRVNKVLGFDASGAPVIKTPTELMATMLTIGNGLQLTAGDLSLINPYAIAVDLRNYLPSGFVTDGSVNYTTQIQAAVTAAANKALIFPSGTWKMGLVTINNPMAIVALGKVTINLTGSGARFRVDTSIAWLMLRDLIFNGSGVAVDDHYALAPNSSVIVIQDLLIDNCSASNVVNGFDTSSAKRVVMIAPKVMTTIGENSGQGYGIVAGGGNGNYSEDVLIIAPYLYRTTRHGIYLGATKRAQIISPIFYQHRNGSAGWSYKSALALSRGEDIAVSNPQFINCADECISLDDDNTVTGQADNFQINGGSIRNSQDVCRALRIGTFGVPSADSSVKRVAIRNMTIELNANLSGTNRDIYVLDGTDVLLDGLHFDGAQAYAAAKEIIYVEGNGSYYGAVTVQNISGRITGSSDKSLVRIDNAICTGTREVNVFNNTMTGLSTGSVQGLISYNTIVTNTNVRTDSKQEISISGATPTVGHGKRFVMTQTGATNVTNFLGGIEGDEITIRFNDNNSTIKNTNIYTQGALDFVGTQHDMMTLQYRGANWREVSRSVN